MHYAIAAKEMDEGNQRYDLWEKSLVITNGATDAARREYIKLRVIQLKDTGENSLYGGIESK